MTLLELGEQLHNLDIPADAYCIGNTRDEALCLLSNYGSYLIFYSERGIATETESFGNESAACTAFVHRINAMLGNNMRNGEPDTAG